MFFNKIRPAATQAWIYAILGHDFALQAEVCINSEEQRIKPARLNLSTMIVTNEHVTCRFGVEVL